MSPLVAAILRDIFTMGCIVALALGHVIPGSTAVALLAPYLALRALLAHKRPPPGGGASSGQREDDAPPTTRQGHAPRKPRRHARVLLDLLPFVAAPVALVLPFWLPNVDELLDGAEQLRQLWARAVDRAELLLWQGAGALASAFRA